MGDLFGPEKQVLLQLDLLYNSEGNPVDRFTLEAYGSRYFCSFKMDWDSALDSLVERNIVEKNDEFLQVREPYSDFAKNLSSLHRRF